MQMDNSSIFFLVVSAAVSFAIGRFIMHWRKRKLAARMEAAKKQSAQALQNLPAEPEARNRAKRKRQLREMEKLANKR